MKKANSQVQLAIEAMKLRRNKCAAGRRISSRQNKVVNSVDSVSKLEENTMEISLQRRRTRYGRAQTSAFDLRSPNNIMINSRPILPESFSSPVAVDLVSGPPPSLPDFEVMSRNPNSQGRAFLAPRLSLFQNDDNDLL